MASFIARLGSIVGSKTLSLLLGILSTPIIVRILGPSGYGDFAFLLSVLGILTIIMNSTIFDGMRKFISEDYENKHYVSEVFGYYIRFSLISISLVLLIFFFLLWFNIEYEILGNKFTIYFLVLFIVFISKQIFALLHGCLMGVQEELKIEPITVFRKFVYLSVGIGLAIYSFDILGLLYGKIISMLVASLIAIKYLVPHIRIRSIFNLSMKKNRRYLRFNVLNMFLILSIHSLYHVDILLLRPLAGSEQVGYYQAALVIAEFLWFVPMAIQIILLQSVSNLWQTEDIEQIEIIVAQITRYVVSYGVLIVIGLALLSKDFVPIYYGSQFESSIIPLLILLPGALGFAIARPMLAVSQASGKLQILIILTMIPVLLNIVLNAALIPRYGMYGAAFSTSTSYYLMLISYLFVSYKLGYNPFIQIEFRKIAFSAIITYILLYAATISIGSPYLRMLVVPILGFTIYTLLLHQFEIVKNSEINYIKSIYK